MLLEKPKDPDSYYERLPELMQEIIDNDQERAHLRAPKVISFAAVQAHRALSARRGDLRIGAKRLWGQNLNKNASGANKQAPPDEFADLSENTPTPAQ